MLVYEYWTTAKREHLRRADVSYLYFTILKCTFIFANDQFTESSSSASPSRTSSNQDLNIDSINLDGNSSPRKQYSYRHRIVHSYNGRIVTPASTIPRFKKYTIYDFNFVKLLGKGSFGKVRIIFSVGINLD